jgi:hypothetical protein
MNAQMRRLGSGREQNGRMWRAFPRIARSAGSPPLLLVVLVGALTVSSARHPGLASALAASPLRVAHGRVWLLLTSGLLAERPIGPSIISFALLAALALVICGRRTFWLAALSGHVLSTLIVYVVISLARLVDSNDFRGVLDAHDYGVSAVSAAWLGAIAAVGWRARGQTPAGRTAIALSCIGVALFAYVMHPGLTILSSEHVFAFAIGIAVAAARAKAESPTLGHVLRLSTPATRRLFAHVDPFVAVTLLVVVVLVCGSVVSSALASLA